MNKRNLEKFTEIKEKIKTEKQKQLKNVHENLDRGKEKLDNLKKELKNVESYLYDEIINSNYELYHNYLILLNKRINEAESELAKINELVKIKEKELLDVHKEIKIFNLLKENIFKDEIQKVIHQEQKETDFNNIARKLKE